MNKFIQAVKDLNTAAVENLIQKDPKWINWAEDDGKNAFHYLCGINIAGDLQKATASLQILKLLLKSGMSINAIQILGLFVSK